MRIKFIRVTTEDKLILQGLLYEPEKETNKVILHIHGMAGNFYENRFLDAMANIFTNNGWAFLSVNTRGHDFIADFPVQGEKEKFKRIGNVFEKFEECVLDIKRWIDFIEKQRFSYVVLQGHSLGCSKVVYYLSQIKDRRVKKLVLASPADMVGLAETEKDHRELLSLSKKMVKEGKGDEILPKLLWGWYYLSAKTYIDFGERDNAIDVFNTYDEDKSSILGEIKIPTLAFFGSKDDAAILPLGEALVVIRGKAKNCPKFDIGIIEGVSHGYFGCEEEAAKKTMRWLSTGNF